jgi:hypothetical protein
MPKTRQTTGKPSTRKAGKPFTASKDRAARKAQPATVSLDQAEREADAILAGVPNDAPPHRVLTSVGRKGRQTKVEASDGTDPNPIAIDPFAEAAELEAEAGQIEAAREAIIVPNPDEAAYAAAEAVAHETGTPIAATLATAEPDAVPLETQQGASLALEIDVGYDECTTLAARIAAMLGRKVRIVDMITLRTLQTVEPPAPGRKPSTGGGKARSVIVEACSRPEGATSAELFTATGWKFASWSHQLKIAAAATGLVGAIRKVDGTTRYFLTQPATAPAADAGAPEAPVGAGETETATTDTPGEAEREQEAA